MKNPLRSALLTATFSLSAALCASPATALTIQGAVYSIQNPSTVFIPVPDRADTIGWAFRLEKTATINALGVYDFGADGLNNEYQVAIYSFSPSTPALGTLVSPIATVPAGTAAALLDSFRWAKVQPFSLGPGSYAVGAYGTYGSNGGDAFVSFQNNTTPNYQVRNGVVFLESRERVGIVGNPSGISYPSQTECTPTPDGFCNGIWGGNFSLIDVPGPLPLLGVGTAFAYSRSLRARIRKSIRSETFS